MLSRGKALVNLALANTSNQAAQRYTIQGHNILNEQDREIKNTTQLTQDTEVHDTRQYAAVNVKLTHTDNHHHDDEATLLSNSATIPSVLESDEEMDEYDLDDDVRDPDWKHEKNAKDNSDSNDEDVSGENNDISGKGIDEVDHEETVEANFHESQTSSASKRKRDRCSLKQKNKKLRMQGDAYLGVKKNDQGVKTHCKERAGRLLCPSGCSKKCEKMSKMRQCSLITDENRNAIFEKFWKTMSWEEKKMYVVSLVEKAEVAQRTTGGPSRRGFSFKYHLWKNNTRVVVCKNYLEPLFASKSEVYREYKAKCTENDKAPYHKTGFTELFHELNLSLYQPKKDQCDTCCGYEAGSNVDEETYQEHLRRKTEAQAAKAADKDLALNDPSLKVVTMDLQSLLICPKLKASSLYYKMKLSCHNFTIFYLSNQKVMNYFWHESEGELTVNCFASCVIDYLNSINTNVVKEVIIYSDGCTYQNRNATLSNAILHFCVKSGLRIEQKYLERGHTQMECDSVHSCVEQKIKKKPIYIPQNYVDFIKEARLGTPYEIQYIDHTFFKDFSGLNYYPSIRPGSGPGSAVVTDVRILKYLPEGMLQFKVHYSDNIFSDIPRARSTRSRDPDATDTVPRLYESSIPIKKTKYQHLQQLKSVLPRDYHSFYDLLPHTN